MIVGFCYTLILYTEPLRQVSGTADGMSANFGMRAVDNISIGETLFTIPRKAVLSEETSAIADLISSSMYLPSGGVRVSAFIVLQ